VLILLAGVVLLASTLILLRWRRVGAENSSTSGDLDVFVDQPTETIDP
jgi:hypothetical protein